MNYRLSTISDTEKSKAQKSFGERSADSPKNFKDVKFFRSWLFYDPDTEENQPPQGKNWNAALGLTLATVLSASFWVGIGLVLAHFWR